jgi:hypothetical protein
MITKIILVSLLFLVGTIISINLSPRTVSDKYETITVYVFLTSIVVLFISLIASVWS